MTAPKPAKVHAPFARLEVWSLNAYQESGQGHEYTCGDCGAALLATALGWVCSRYSLNKSLCEYTQNWAHAQHANWMWKGDFNQPPPPVPAGLDEWR